MLVGTLGDGGAIRVGERAERSVGELGAWCAAHGVDAWYTKNGHLGVATSRAQEGACDRGARPPLALPLVRHVPLEAAWGGPIDVTALHLPFFGALPGGAVHYGLGYTGGGVGPCHLGGKVLSGMRAGVLVASPICSPVCRAGSATSWVPDLPPAAPGRP